MKTIGVVLAGGLSSRMQADKTQFIWQGKTLIEHTTELLLDAGCDEVIVSNNDNPHYIQDRYPNAGPLAGIDACLNYIQTSIVDAEAMLIMPVDMPLMSINLLRNLRNRVTKDKAVFYNLGRLPIILSVNDKLASQLSDSLTEHQSGSAVSIRQLVAQLDCQVLNIDKDQQRLFFNCNTPEQWQNLSTT